MEALFWSLAPARVALRSESTGPPALLKDAGFQDVQIAGGFDGRPFRHDTDELVIEGAHRLKGAVAARQPALRQGRRCGRRLCLTYCQT